ncbi:MAG: NAD(P)H-binding protein, partial [Longimicrobiales bacterium]
MKVLITGATGVIGRSTASELLGRGHVVRLLSRNARQDADAWDGAVEPFPADIGDPEAVYGAAEGCHAVIHIAGILEESPPDVTYERINLGGTANMAVEASRAGAHRMVFVSSLGVERGSSAYHESKRAAEEVIRASDIDWVIVRPGSVLGPGDEAISLLLRMVRVLPVIPVIEAGDQEFQPIWHEDMAWALAECVERQDMSGRTLEVAGPERITVDELIDDFAELTGRRPPRVPLPRAFARLGAELAVALGVETLIKPATITMLMEGNTIPPGHPNGLTDVLGREVAPIADRLEQLADALPEQTPEQGVGALERRRFRVEIRNAQCSAQELLEKVRSRFDDFVAFDAEAEPGTDSRIEVGATLSLELPPRGHAQVRVEEIDDRSITLATVEGHPLAGVVRFEFLESDNGVLTFTIDLAERPATRLDQMVMALVGRSTQRRAWSETAERVVRASGGEAPQG